LFHDIFNMFLVFHRVSRIDSLLAKITDITLESPFCCGSLSREQQGS
jgi:hypothetical protein